MRTIHKFQCSAPGTFQTVQLPGDAHVLCAQMQHGKMMFWVLLDPDAPKSDRRFVVYGTGWNIPDTMHSYCGTVQDELGFVWHLFEVMG